MNVTVSYEQILAGCIILLLIWTLREQVSKAGNLLLALICWLFVAVCGALVVGILSAIASLILLGAAVFLAIKKLNEQLRNYRDHPFVERVREFLRQRQ